MKCNTGYCPICQHLTATANKGRLQTKTERYKAKFSHKGGCKLTATKHWYKTAQVQEINTGKVMLKLASVCLETLGIRDITEMSTLLISKLI